MICTLEYSLFPFWEQGLCSTFRTPRLTPSRASPYVARVMANLEILTIPDPILRQKSAPVETVDDETRRFMDQMLQTMYEAPGIGLAAIQVGEPRRIITIDVAREEEPKSPLFLINPEIVWSSEDERSTYEEGCLSIPDYYAEVERPAKVRVRYRRL